MFAAIHPENFTCNVLRADEVQHRVGNIIGCAPTFQHGAVCDSRHAFRRIVRWRQDGTWDNRVDAHMRREFERELARHRDEPRFADTMRGTSASMSAMLIIAPRCCRSINGATAFAT